MAAIGPVSTPGQRGVLLPASLDAELVPPSPGQTGMIVLFGGWVPEASEFISIHTSVDAAAAATLKDAIRALISTAVTVTDGAGTSTNNVLVIRAVPQPPFVDALGQYVTRCAWTLLPEADPYEEPAP